MRLWFFAEIRRTAVRISVAAALGVVLVTAGLPAVISTAGADTPPPSAPSLALSIYGDSAPTTKTSSTFGTVNLSAAAGIGNQHDPGGGTIIATASAQAGGVSSSITGSGYSASYADASVLYWLRVVGPGDPGTQIPIIVSVNGTSAAASPPSTANVVVIGTFDSDGITPTLPSLRLCSTSGGGDTCGPTGPTFNATLSGAVRLNSTFDLAVAVNTGVNDGGPSGPQFSGSGSVNIAVQIDPSFPNASQYSVTYGANVPTLASAKDLGGCFPGAPFCGEPINVGTGNEFERVNDYQTVGENTLSFTRYYNSLGDIYNPSTFATSLGGNWRSSYDRYLKVSTPTMIMAERADGQVPSFTWTGSTWTADSDVDIKLVQSGSTWTLIDHDDSVETYTAISANEAILTSIKARNGYTQTLSYNGGNQLTSVTDSYRRSLSFAYSNGLLSTVTAPDGLVLSYGYNSSGINPGVNDRLVSVGYSTNPPTSQSYVYENASFPLALTGIIDENSNRFATWTYDSSGRATSSQHAGGADRTTITYNDSDGSRTVTNALGEREIYRFTVLQGVPKVAGIDRQ
jgi:hypothetical protein